jgi:hypothetical protein
MRAFWHSRAQPRTRTAACLVRDAQQQRRVDEGDHEVEILVIVERNKHALQSVVRTQEVALQLGVPHPDAAPLRTRHP